MVFSNWVKTFILSVLCCFSIHSLRAQVPCEVITTPPSPFLDAFEDPLAPGTGPVCFDDAPPNGNFEVQIPFSFCFYNQTFTSFFINNNGNITFGNAYTTFSATGFPDPSIPAMIAPFWADVYTGNTFSPGPCIGQVRYEVSPNHAIVYWENVGVFPGSDPNQVNSFQVIISDGTSPLLPPGCNVGFIYGDMEWTTGTASSGAGGFGGIPATVGVNRGDGVEFFLVGLFDQNSSLYDGPGGSNDGVNFLDDKLFFYNVCLPSGGLNNIPPIGFIPCEPIVICGGTPVTIDFDFDPVEVTQTITTVSATSSDPSLVLSTIITPSSSNPSGGATSNVQTSVDYSLAPPGTYTVSFTATDDGTPAQTSTIEFTVVNTTPTPVISYNSPLCEGTTLNLFATSTITIPTLTYQWTGPNGFSSTLQNPTITNVPSLNAGDYTCQVFVNSCPSLIATTTVAVNPNPPTPTVTTPGPITLCAGDPLALTITPTPTITISDYEWTKISSPGIVLSSTNSLNITSITTGQAGQYSIRVKSGGCWSQPYIIDVVVKPIPTIPAFTPINVCSGDVLNLIGPAPAPNPAVTEYAWSKSTPPPITFLGSTSTPNFLVTNSATLIDEGTYSLIISVNGCPSLPGSVLVDVIPMPTSDAGSDQPVCSGVPLNIGNSTLPATNAYSWSPTAGLNSSTIPNPILELPNFSDLPYDTTYTVTTSITVSTTTCTSQDNVVVTIKPQPNGTFEIPEPQCFNDNSFDFVAIGNYSSTATFEWDFGPWANVPATTNLTDENPQDISFNATGNQLVRFTVTEDGCEGYPYQSSVMIHKMPVSNFSADTLVGCSPMVVNFSNLSQSVDPFKTTEWSILGETIISNTDPTIVFDRPGEYDISLKVTTVNGCEDTYFINNFINVYPSPRADFILSPEVVQITDPDIEFNDLSSDASNIYYEIELDGSIVTLFQANPTYTFLDTGLYNVRQVVSTQFGCVDSLTKQAVVELGYKYFIPAGFSPNGDGLNDYFKVSGEDVIDFSMIVYNRWGQKLYQSFDMDNGWDGKTKLGDEVVDGGVYFYRVEMTQRNGLKNTIEGHVQIIK